MDNSEPRPKVCGILTHILPWAGVPGPLLSGFVCRLAAACSQVRSTFREEMVTLLCSLKGVRSVEPGPSGLTPAHHPHPVCGVGQSLGLPRMGVVGVLLHRVLGELANLQKAPKVEPGLQCYMPVSYYAVPPINTEALTCLNT